jgi:hypothetical protein
MGKVAGKFVIILDIQKVLSIDEMAMLVAVGQSNPETLDLGEGHLKPGSGVIARQ